MYTKIVIHKFCENVQYTFHAAFGFSLVMFSTIISSVFSFVKSIIPLLKAFVNKCYRIVIYFAES